MAKKVLRAGGAKRKAEGKLRLSEFARALLREWNKLHLPLDARAVIAVSGGADSLALLLGVNELIGAKKLKLKIFVAHLDHGLRKETSRADARWVASLGKQLGYVVISRRVNVAAQASKTGDNLEQVARRARYKFLAEVAQNRRAEILLTAHTMDDQAETILLNLLRGTGMDGLAGIDAVRPTEKGSKLLLARPLLSWARRKDTESYCRLRAFEFRVDEMNANEKFARVRVRRQLLPLMESFNPKITEGLARTAELLREDSEALTGAATRLIELANGSGEKKSGRKGSLSLSLDLLSQAQPALRRRALRQWIRECRGDLRRVERIHILAVESLLFGNRGGRTIELPGGSKISRKSGLLQFVPGPQSAHLLRTGSVKPA